jgi:hypothetical protein
MLTLINHSHIYFTKLYTGFNEQQQLQMTCLIKAAWKFNFQGELTALTVREFEIEETDRYLNKPHHSSLIAANEIMSYKKGAELLLYGTAQIPHSNSTSTHASLQIEWPGKSWKKTLYIFGKRYWRSCFLRKFPSKPEILTPLPLQYEFAFGGKDKKTNQLYAANPIGLGFTTSRHIVDLALPQIETIPLITRISHHPIPAGFAPLAPAWQLTNQTKTESFYPTSSAPLDQRFNELFKGGEKIALQGLVASIQPNTLLSFHLPYYRPKLQLYADQKQAVFQPLCDTIVIDSDKKILQMIWRLGIPWLIESDKEGVLLLIE